jgi:hypothetical protein
MSGAWHELRNPAALRRRERDVSARKHVAWFASSSRVIASDSDAIQTKRQPRSPTPDGFADCRCPRWPWRRLCGVVVVRCYSGELWRLGLFGRLFAAASTSASIRLTSATEGNPRRFSTASMRSIRWPGVRVPAPTRETNTSEVTTSGSFGSIDGGSAPDGEIEQGFLAFGGVNCFAPDFSGAYGSRS